MNKKRHVLRVIPVFHIIKTRMERVVERVAQVHIRMIRHPQKGAKFVNAAHIKEYLQMGVMLFVALLKKDISLPMMQEIIQIQVQQ